MRPVSPIMGVVGYNVQVLALRKNQGMSQEELGRVAGVSQSDISRIERGWVPPEDLQERVASVLGVSRDVLFEKHASVA